jgi:hypothetical protein
MGLHILDLIIFCHLGRTPGHHIGGANPANTNPAVMKETKPPSHHPVPVEVNLYEQ